MDVPGCFAKHRQERVHRDEANPSLDEPPCQEAGLPEPVPAVPVADGIRFLGKIERVASLFARHQLEGGVEVFVHQAGVFAAFKFFDRAFHNGAHLLAAFHPQGTDLVGGEQVRHLEVGLRRVGHEREGIVRLAEETARLAVWKVAASPAHEFREHDEGREVASAPQEVACDGAHVWCLHAAREAPSCLHHLPSGVVHRRAVVMAGAHQGELVRDFCMQRQDLRDLDVRRFCADGAERAADFRSCVRFHVPEVDMAWPAEVEEEDAGVLVVALADCARLLGGHVLGQ